MAHLRCDFFSDALGLSTSMTVILPQQTSGQIGMRGTAPDADPPVLYLLHGLSDDDTIWLRRTSIERYVSAMGLAVVMPQVHRSFYTDEARGLRYWTFLTEELPELIGRFFRVSSAADGNLRRRAVDGRLRRIQMGAAGTRPVCCRGKLVRRTEHRPRREQRGLARRIRHLRIGCSGTGLRPAATMTCCGWSGAPGLTAATCPQLYLCCGTDDALFADNVHFRDVAVERGLPLTVDFGPGEHEWGYWDAKIQDVLSWLPLRGKHRQER